MRETWWSLYDSTNKSYLLTVIGLSESEEPRTVDRLRDCPSSLDFRLMAVGFDSAGRVTIYQADTLKEAATFPIPHCRTRGRPRQRLEDCRKVRWCPARLQSAIATWSGRIFIWEPFARANDWSKTLLSLFRSNSVVLKTELLRKPVSALAWSGDGKFLVSGSTDGQAVIWNADTHQRHREYRYLPKLMSPVTTRPGITSIDWSPNGRAIALGCSDGHVRLWDPTSNRIVERVVATRDRCSPKRPVCLRHQAARDLSRGQAFRVDQVQGGPLGGHHLRRGIMVNGRGPDLLSRRHRPALECQRRTEADPRSLQSIDGGSTGHHPAARTELSLSGIDRGRNPSQRLISRTDRSAGSSRPSCPSIPGEGRSQRWDHAKQQPIFSSVLSGKRSSGSWHCDYSFKGSDPLLRISEALFNGSGDRLLTLVD
jgi:WD40 repeat protein